MAQDRKALLAVILAVKRGFVSPEDGMALLDQVDAEDDVDAAAKTVYEQVPQAHVDELREEAAALAEDPKEAERVLEEAGVPKEVQETLLNLGLAQAKREDFEATLLSLSPNRQTTIIERPKLKTAVAERYKILREHARGGMGRILVAVDSVVGREVALKELLPGRGGSGSQPMPRAGSAKGTPSNDTTAAAARFLREATVTGQLEHPNIVPVYEIGQRDDASLYYTMKFVKGRTLASRLKMIRTDVDLNEAEKQAERMKLLDAFVAVCNAIAFAHSRGVIHRDLKPANIMLGDFGEALVLDWGLARVRGGEESALTSKVDQASSPDLTLEGEVMGTPAYMPPEQAAGKLDLVDERSDVYSLGAVLFEIVSGEAPYAGKTAKAVLSSVLSEPPRRIYDVAPDAPAELAAVCNRALAREPKDRFQSARELAEEVQAFRDGRMVSIYKYSAVELLKRFVAKNRAAVAITILALLVLVAGGVYGYVNVTRERDTALRAEAEAQIQQGIAETQATEAEKQKGIAESQAREAEHQKGIATERAAEAEVQKGIAKERADEAEKQKRAAFKSASEAENERKRADEKAAEAAKQAALAQMKEEESKRALALAQRNLADAHLGYATLAEERGQAGARILHLAASHAADAGVVSSGRVVAALSESSFPLWRTRSYIDLPAGAAAFSTDRRMCAAPLHRPPRDLDEFNANANSLALKDVGIWDVATGTLLRRLSTEVQIQRTLLFSDDGTRLVALESSGGMRIWDVETGEELISRAVQDWSSQPLLVPGAPGRFLTGGADGRVWETSFTDGSAGAMVNWPGQYATALAASADGQLVAAGNSDGEVMVWDLATQDPPRSIKRLDGVTWLHFTQHGLLVGFSTGVIELWDLAGPTQVRSFKTGEFTTGDFCGMELSADGKLLAVGKFDRGWRLLDFETGTAVVIRGEDKGRIVGLGFSPGGDSIVLALKGEGFDVFSREGKSLLERTPDHLLGSLALGISPDGETYASGDYGGFLLKRKVSDGTTLWARKISSSNIQRVMFSPDGATVAAFTADGVLYMVDAETGESRRFLRQSAYSYTLKFSPDGRYLCMPAPDGAVHMVDPATATIVKSMRIATDTRVLGVAFDPAHERVWLIDQFLKQWAWDYETSKKAEFQGQLFKTHGPFVYSTDVSPDGKVAVMAFSDGTVIGWQPEPFTELYGTKIGEGPIINCAFGAGSAFYACGTGDGMLCFVDAKRGTVVKRQRAHRAAIMGTAVSPDGGEIITSGVDGEFLAWEAPQMMAPERIRAAVSHTGNVVVSPDGELGAAVSDSNAVRLFNVNDGENAGEVDFSPCWVTGLGFSVDGSRLAISHSGGRVVLWDVALAKVTLEIAVNDYAMGVAWDAEGRLLVAGSYYGLQVRDATTGELIHSHRSDEALSQVYAFPTGRRALLASTGSESRVVDTDTGEVLARIERSANYGAMHAISPDGAQIAMVRDRGLIAIYDSATGKRLRTLKVRMDNIASVHFHLGDKRLFYLGESGGAAIVDAASGAELAGTWFPYPFATRAALPADGSFALIGTGTGHIEYWRLKSVIERFDKLSSLDLKMLVALTQVQSELKLDNLKAVPLPRRTGGAAWLTADRLAPEFLRGKLPDWAPSLGGADIEFARDFLSTDLEKRRMRLRNTGREWVDAFEGWRYREEMADDLSIRRIAIPPRRKDALGKFIGEPQGKVDYLGWVKARRENRLKRAGERVQNWVARAEAAGAEGNWRLAQRWYNFARNADESRTDILVAYAWACHRLGESWAVIWWLQSHEPAAQAAYKGEFYLVWGVNLATNWDKRGMLDRFDQARKAGYSKDDWYLYRVEALETTGAYKEAAQEAGVAVTRVTDAGVKAQLNEVIGRCNVWETMRQGQGDLPAVIVTGVAEGSSAQQAGLKPGDRIMRLHVEGEERFDIVPDSASNLQATWDQFLNTCEAAKQQVILTVRRDGAEITLTHKRAPFDASLFTLKANPD